MYLIFSKITRTLDSLGSFTGLELIQKILHINSLYFPNIYTANFRKLLSNDAKVLLKTSDFEYSRT